MPPLVRAYCAAVLAVLVLLSGAAFASELCRPDVVWLRQNGTSARFSVEIADTEALRGKGLMFRETLGRFDAMLFVYDAPQKVYFWMKNTPLPLDMFFIDARGVVVSIAGNTVPFSEKAIFGGNRVLMVLETNAGMADALGIGKGAEIRHPRLDQSTAAWPCPAK